MNKINKLPKEKFPDYLVIYGEKEIPIFADFYETVGNERFFFRNHVNFLTKIVDSKILIAIFPIDKCAIILPNNNYEN
jgi:hypothetical protein